MSEIDPNLPDRIYETFINKTIFLTGGTGYLGKVFIERLLRMLDVNKIYILIRSKRDQTPEARLQKVLSSPLFDEVRRQKGEEILRKCQVISGDVSMDNLGISESDRLLLQKEVNFVFHSAATVRFDDPLKTTVMINVKGVQGALKIAKEMEKLQIFIHISTAYCHPEEKVLFEKFYRTSMKPEQVIQMMEWLTDKQTEEMTKSFLQQIPNTYTFTKALAEELVHKEVDNLPVIIVRPSIVTPIWKEPIPGWTDNINGPTGLMIAAGKGVQRTMYGKRDVIADFISVDGSVDVTFAVVAHSVVNGRTRNIFNLCTSEEILLTWGDVIDIGRDIAHNEVPFDIILWRPGGNMKNSKIVHLLSVLLYQLIPALFIDAIAYCFGYKPFLWKIQKRLWNGMRVLEYYTTNQWKFSDTNYSLLKQWLNAKERSRYVVTLEGLDLRKYFINSALAARKYILKEPENNLPRARRLMKFMVWLDSISNVLIKLLLAYLFYKYIFLCLYTRCST